MHFSFDYYGLEINVEREYINNIKISVSAQMKINVLAPMSLSETVIKDYIQSNIGRIKKEVKILRTRNEGVLENILKKRIVIFGQVYDSLLLRNEFCNYCDIDKAKHTIRIGTIAEYSAIQIADYVKRKLLSYVSPMVDEIFEEAKTTAEVDVISWRFNVFLKNWVEYNDEKKILYINPQIIEAHKDWLKIAMLDCLLRFNCVTDETYMYVMQSSTHRLKAIKSWLENKKPVEIPYSKEKTDIVLISMANYGYIKDSVNRKLIENGLNPHEFRVDIQNIVRLTCNEKGYFTYDILVSCSNMSSDVIWYKVSCDKTKDEFLINSVDKYYPYPLTPEEAEKFIPPVSGNSFDFEASLFLNKYFPKALSEAVAVPIKSIAEDMGLRVLEVVELDKDVGASGITTFDDSDIPVNIDNNLGFIELPGNTILINADIDDEIDICEKNYIIAHELYHWYKHKPFFSVVNKTFNSNSPKMNAVLCFLQEKANKESTVWSKSFDVIEHQASNAAVLCPVLEKAGKDSKGWSKLFDVIELQADNAAIHIMTPSKMVKKHFLALKEAGLVDVDSMVGVSEVIRSFSEYYCAPMRFVASVLKDTGCIRAVSTSDDKESHIIDLKKMVKYSVSEAETKSRNIRGLPDSFSATLRALIDEDKEERRRMQKSDISHKELAEKYKLPDELFPLVDKSGISERTLSRMRTKDGQEITLQMVLGVCCGLRLSLPETEMLLDKSPFRLRPNIREHYVYKAVIPLFNCCTIGEINEILERAGVRKIGAAKDNYAAKKK